MKNKLGFLIIACTWFIFLNVGSILIYLFVKEYDITYLMCFKFMCVLFFIKITLNPMSIITSLSPESSISKYINSKDKKDASSK